MRRHWKEVTPCESRPTMKLGAAYSSLNPILLPLPAGPYALAPKGYGLTGV
jgi:hypothetical protein